MKSRKWSENSKSMCQLWCDWDKMWDEHGMVMVKILGCASNRCSLSPFLLVKFNMCPTKYHWRLFYLMGSNNQTFDVKYFESLHLLSESSNSNLMFRSKSSAESPFGVYLIDLSFLSRQISDPVLIWCRGYTPAVDVDVSCRTLLIVGRDLD